MNYFLVYILLDSTNNKDIDSNEKNNNNIWIYNKNDVVKEEAPTKLKDTITLYASIFVIFTAVLCFYYCR